MRIVTYNIHKGMDANNKITLNKIGDYLNKLNCDIICLQEVLYHQYVELKKITCMEGVFAANVKNTSMRYGICIFSNSKIICSEHIFLSSKKEQRGFLSIKIQNEEQMNIVNTHLGLDKEERRTQIDEILNYINSIEGKNILCGDFNEKNISISTFIDSSYFKDKYKMCTFSKTDARIDYIYVENGIIIKNYDVERVYLSDHYPVIVEI